MSKPRKQPAPDMGSLAEDARALMVATADVAGEKVKEARERLAEALDSAKELYQRVQENALEKAKQVDRAVRGYPYQTAAVAFCLGTLFGVLISRRK